MLTDAPSLTPAAVTAWLGGFQQTDRLLRLHTPLGPNVLLAETLQGIECISSQMPGITGFKFQLDALSLDAHLELKTLLGQSVLVELLTDQSRTQLRPLHGHVTAASCIGSNGGMARYRLVIEPWLSFLGHGRDCAVFQDKTVLDIVQSVLTDYQNTYQGSGKLAPLWRLDVQDASVYPQRSLTTQYQESDLAFVERLLAQEGLFYWFEHSGEVTNASLGSHTMVIADHNGAFAPNARASIRFSQSKGTITDDTIDRWRPQLSWHTHAIEMASWDYRSLDSHSVAEHSSAGPTSGVPADTPTLIRQDTPAAYAYQNRNQGQRLARNQLQAHSVAGHTISAAGSVRTLRPATTFTLSGHASSPISSPSATERYVVLSVIHHARNNLSAQLRAQASVVTQKARAAMQFIAQRRPPVPRKTPPTAPPTPTSSIATPPLCCPWPCPTAPADWTATACTCTPAPTPPAAKAPWSSACPTST
jgi:type VI secretion system secreted protein VgrG